MRLMADFSDAYFSHILSPVFHQKLSSTPNSPGSYEYFKSIPLMDDDLPMVKGWDLGSLECQSETDGMCNRWVKGPAEDCSGPGCGTGSWQDLSGRCHQITDHMHQSIIEERLNRTFIAPSSVVNKYYSSCRIKGNYDTNCQWVQWLSLWRVLLGCCLYTSRTGPLVRKNGRGGENS